MAGISAALFIGGSITMDWATGDYAFAYPGVLQPSSIDEGLYLSERGPEKECHRQVHAARCSCNNCIELREFREFRQFKQARARSTRARVFDAPPPYHEPFQYVPAAAPAVAPAPAVSNSTQPNSCTCGDTAVIRLMLLFIIIAIAAMAFGMAIAPQSVSTELTGANRPANNANSSAT